MAKAFNKATLLVLSTWFSLFVTSAAFGFNGSGAPSFLSSKRTSSGPQKKIVGLSLSSGTNNDRVPLGNGSYVALVTPMQESGAVDLALLRSSLQWHVESGTDGLCILGTTGEASTLSMKEREDVLKVAVEEVKGTIPILVGTGTINPDSVKEQTLQAIDLGCDAALVVTPYYVKPPQRALVKHFHTVADLGLPVMLYNVPGRTAVDMSAETIALCAAHGNIVGLKDATGQIERVAEVRGLCGEDFLLLSGDDGTSADFIVKGGNGCISVTANVCPAKMHQMMELLLEGKTEEAMRINAELDQLNQKLFVEANPIPVKWALQRMGKLPTAYCRPPLIEMASEYYPILEEALTTGGCI